MASYRNDYQLLLDSNTLRQADVCAEAIGRLQFPKKPVFYYVDVGSHEGKLTSLVVKELAKKQDLIATMAIEPGGETCKTLKSNLGNNVSVHNLTYGEWLRDSINNYGGHIDLVLNSHTLYHFQDYQWSSVFIFSDFLLNQEGKHIVILDSDTSPHVELKETLEEKIPTKKHEVFGRYLTGSSVMEYLHQGEYTFSHRDLPSPIHFEDNEETLDRVCHFLGFIFRYEASDVKEHCREEVEEFINRYRLEDGILIPRNQDFIVIPKQDSEFT